MKYLVRLFLFHVFALWFTSQVLPTLIVRGNWQVLFTGGLVLSLLMLLIAPVLRILFIPINILTFGLLSWFVNVVVLWLLTLVVPEISVRAWTFPGSSWGGFVIPPIHLDYVPSLIISSLVLTFLTNLLHHVSEE